MCCCVPIQDRGFFVFVLCRIKDFQTEKKSNSGLPTSGKRSAIFSSCQLQSVDAVSCALLMVLLVEMAASVCSPREQAKMV